MHLTWIFTGTDIKTGRTGDTKLPESIGKNINPH